jgi:hypothetical protein
MNVYETESFLDFECHLIEYKDVIINQYYFRLVPLHWCFGTEKLFFELMVFTVLFHFQINLRKLIFKKFHLHLEKIKFTEC